MLTLEILPYSEIEELSSVGRIRKILNIAKEDKIVLIQGRLTKEEEAELIKVTMEEINKDLSSDELLWPKLVSLKVVNFNGNTEVGQEVAEFTVTMKLEVAVVIFNEGQLVSAIKNQLKSLNPNERSLVGLDQDSFVYSVQDYSLENKSAEVKLLFQAESVINSGLDFFDKGKLVGKTADEIKSYFSQFPQVKSVDVVFKPAWLKKTPRLKDKIEIKIGG